jgi:VWFA-related protein
MKNVFASALVTLVVAAGSYAQVTTPTPPNDADDVVKITTKLVQVDVVVTDKKGNQVRDLRAGDFELRQDGKPQRILSVTYVPLDTESVTGTVTTQRPTGGVPPPPATRRFGGGRVIALLVDDGSCAASFWGMNNAKDGIKRFINEQLRPDDVVAIYQTRSGSSAFQQYTSDKAALLRTVEKIRFLPAIGCGTSDGSFYEAAARARTEGMAPGVGAVGLETDVERKAREYREDAVKNNQVVGTLGVLRYAINGLERAPGRKLMFVFSDSLAFRNRQNESLSAREALREVTDAANRAGVAVNTISVRGVDTFSAEARDDIDVKTGNSGSVLDARRSQSEKDKEGLRTLAYDTGGSFYEGGDRLNVPLADVLRRESGYYLLAYEPADDTFKNKKFNKIDVNVKIPDLRVDYRAGFVGVPDAEATRPKRKSADSELYEAIASPLPRPGLSISMVAHYGRSAEAGDFVRAMFHIDGSQLTFSDEPNGQKKAVLDVVAVTMDEKNDVVDEFTRTHTLKFDTATAERIAANGLTYSTDVPVKKSGTYNFRVAVRDANSRQIGSAAQVVQIPDLGRSGLFLSGLAVSAVDGAGKFQRPGPTGAANAIDVPASMAVPAIRRFKRGSVLAYSFSVYNARTGKDGSKPNLTAQVNLYRNGSLVLEGPAEALKLEGAQDPARIDDYGYIRLSATEPGEYTLQLVVRNPTAGRDAVSSQWIDFSVVD